MAHSQCTLNSKYTQNRLRIGKQHIHGHEHATNHDSVILCHEGVVLCHETHMKM